MKNYRTTIIGALLAGLSFLAIYQQNGGSLSNWQQWLIPALIAVLGYVAKDAGVTGSLKLLLASLCLLTLPACQSPQDTQRLGALVNLAITVAEQRGKITAADAAAIRAAETIIIPPNAAPPVVSGK